MLFSGKIQSGTLLLRDSKNCSSQDSWGEQTRKVEFGDWVGVEIEKEGEKQNKFKQERGLVQMMTICSDLRNMSKLILCTWGPVGKRKKK